MLLKSENALTVVADHIQQAIVLIIYLLAKCALLILDPFHETFQSIIAALAQQYPQQHWERGH